MQHNLSLPDRSHFPGGAQPKGSGVGASSTRGITMWFSAATRRKNDRAPNLPIREHPQRIPNLEKSPFSFRIPLVLPTIRFALLILLAAMSLIAAAAQEPPANPESNQPQVKVNVLNVCTPSAEEQKEITSALARIPKQPLFGADFEITRGRSTVTDMPNFLQPGQGARVSSEPSVAGYVDRKSTRLNSS